MKKVFIVSIMFSLLCPLIFSENLEESNIIDKRKGIELNCYLLNDYALGEISEFALVGLGGGIGVEYTIPPIPFLGFVGRIDVNSKIPKISRVTSWIDININAGVHLNFNFGKFIVLRPELAYGILLHSAVLDNNYSVFTDQIIQFALTLCITESSFAKDGLSFQISPFYNLITEKQDALHYLGFRTGIAYKFR